MKGVYFKDNFWSTDIISTAGYDILIQHMNDGRKNCKEYEDFLKDRAVIEEKYGKDLVNLTKKKACGQNEINTLKRALDVFKQQIDNVGQCHIQLAQALRDEAKRMEEFRERQKQERKKIEVAMEAIHKHKHTHYKRTMDVSTIRALLFLLLGPRKVSGSPTVIFSKLAQTKVASEDSDKLYQQNISTLDKIREDWQNEHISACVNFENQEGERINYFRNAVWTHVNQLSKQCVSNDVMYEEVRKALEGCNIEKDIEYFTENHKTGDKPPAPIAYENFYNPPRNTAVVRNQAVAGIRRGPLPPLTSAPVTVDPDYASVGDYNVYQ
ncbi:proline-serine-threonine phosphatase-interacting protein 2 [Ascaphus truei]|uniref:proline-serine-threonine phosphatase-interacting protein 2 n=1 Tax=Ascaphus truei TaxID=8439 RepID=UPI003F595DFC